MTNQVTFDPAVGGDGSTVSDGRDPSTGLDGGGWRTRFVPALAQVVAIATWVKNRALDVVGYANTASAAATTATNAANQAAALLDAFDDRYLGQKAADPALDNDGNALQVGAIYWNTTTPCFRVWNGAAWENGFLPQSGYATLTGAETLTNKTLTAPVVNGGTVSKATLTGVKETKVAMGASDIDLDLGNWFTKTIAGVTTLTVSHVPAAGTVAAFILELTNGGSATVNLPAGSKTAGGSAFSFTVSGRDVVGAYTHDGGTTWTWMMLVKDAK